MFYVYLFANSTIIFKAIFSTLGLGNFLNLIFLFYPEGISKLYVSSVCAIDILMQVLD